MARIQIIADTPVAYVAKSGNPASAAGEAFAELEKRVPLRGNKFYGVAAADEYWACVALNETNGESIRGLSHGVIRGGAYACAVLTGEYDDLLQRIGPAFDALAAEHSRDQERPCVEFYKRYTEIVAMLPVMAEQTPAEAVQMV